LNPFQNSLRHPHESEDLILSQAENDERDVF